MTDGQIGDDGQSSRSVEVTMNPENTASIEREPSSASPKDNGGESTAKKHPEGAEKSNGKPKQETSSGSSKPVVGEEQVENEKNHNRLSTAMSKIKSWKWPSRSSNPKTGDVETGQNSGGDVQSTSASKDNQKPAEQSNGNGHAVDGSTQATVSGNKAEEKDTKTSSDPENTAGKDQDTNKNEKKNFYQHIRSLISKTKLILLGVLLLMILAFIIIMVLVLLPRNEPKNPHPSETYITEPEAGTSCGLVRGKKDDRGAMEFLGIPYALPPMGKHRFKLPRIPSTADECWQGILDVQFKAPLCPQEPIPGMGDIQYSEDCLTLDVRTPKFTPRTRRPVVVYIPGTSLLGFSEQDVKYHPTGHLADLMQSVFVTIRYRTGVLGFMALEELAEETIPKVSGNYGMYDIRAALQWVHTNIHNFGGDPDRVTVLGHGSSATLVLSLMASNLMNDTHRIIQGSDMRIVTKPLFHQAWLTGGSVNFPTKPLKQSYAENSEFFDKLNCRTVSCLYKRSSGALVAAIPNAWKKRYSLTVPQKDETYPRIIVQDGVMVKQTPVEAMEENKLSKIPIVLGSVFHEYESPVKPNLNSWQDFASFMRTSFKPLNETLAENIVAVYTDNSTTPLHQYYSVVTDVRITCPIQQFAEKYAKYFESDSVYKYMVHYEYSKVDRATKKPYLKTGTHGLDISSIFQQLPEFLNDYSIKSEWMLEATLQQLFFDFVHGYHERYDLKPSKYINIIDNDGKLHPSTGSYKGCDIWDNNSVVPNYGRVN